MQSGIFLILISMSLTPLGDALSKHLGDSQPPILVVFARYFVAGLLACAIALVTGRRVHLPRRGRAGFVLQTALVVGAMALLVRALAMVPLALAVGGFLIAPIVATLLSVLLYRAALTLPRALGAGLSLAGALMILRPDTGLAENVQAGVLIALAGGALLGAFLALTRHAPQGLPALSSLALQCLLGAAMLLPFAAMQMDFRALEAALLWPVLGLGVITAMRHFLTVAAYQRAEAAQLAPFFYFNLVAAVVVGLVWFNEVPAAFTLAGLGLILSGGLVSLVAPGLISARLRPFRSDPRTPRHISVKK